jgi:hypothetical protein
MGVGSLPCTKASYTQGFCMDDITYGKADGLPGSSTAGSSKEVEVMAEAEAEVDFSGWAGGGAKEGRFSSLRLSMRFMAGIEDPKSLKSPMNSDGLHGDGEPIEANISVKDAGT